MTEIIAIGADIVDIRRIEKILQRFGERFENRVFQKNEIQLARKRKNTAQTYAKRFAAKEACAKALGTGFAQGVRMIDIFVENDKNGKPNILLLNNAKNILYHIIPKNMKPKLHITITDEYPYAYAQVIITAEKEG